MPKAYSREEVLKLVRDGQMSTQDADLWAEKNGTVFECRPEHRDPMEEENWSLPMTAAWIIDRTQNAVYSQWDAIREQQSSWVFVGDGYEIQRPGPARLDGIVSKLVSFEFVVLRFEPIEELWFALQNEQLRATGIASGDRCNIVRSAWRRRPEGSTGLRGNDLLWAYDLLAQTDGLFDIYDKVQVPRTQVLSIWAPLSSGSTTSTQAGQPTHTPAQTLPADFERYDWSVEHVLAWLVYRNMRQIEALGLNHPERPKWYGKMYKSGFAGEYGAAERLLHQSLLSEALQGKIGTRLLKAGWTRDHDVIHTNNVWFSKDAVMRLLLPEPHDCLTDDLMPSRIATLRLHKKRGPPPIKLNNVVEQMQRDLINGKYTKLDLEDMKHEALASEYKVSRETALKARAIVVPPIEENPISDN